MFHTYTKQAFCYIPTKRKLYADYSEAKSPVKISKFTTSKGSIVLGKFSKIVPVSLDDVSFKYNSKLDSGNVLQLRDLAELASWQLISTKISVASVDEVQDHMGVDGKIIPKQSVTIRDSTACRPLILYGEDVGKLKVNQCYLLKNIRLRKVKGKVFLNTTKTEPFIAEEIDEIENLAPIKVGAELTEGIIVGRIIGLSSIIQTYHCKVCGRKGEVKMNAFHCEYCKIQLAVKMTPCKWSIGLVLADTTSQDSHVLYLANDAVQQLVSLFNITLTTEDEVAASLLNDPLDPVKLKFDIISKTVYSIEKAD